ncbi:MAG: pyridoxal-phosphate dependent enzyme [Geminicoccaceae bacterium]
MHADLAATAAASVRAHARIRDHIRRTPLLPSLALGPRAGSGLLFKAEQFQRTGSFKSRGAFSKLTSLAVDDTGLVTASSGNHGLATSDAAAVLGKRLTVHLPESVEPSKLAAIQARGVEIVLHPGDSGVAEQRARADAERRGLVYVSPYNDPEVVAGQGTIGLELLDERVPIDAVFVAMGGGGLIGGIGAVLKCFAPHIRIIGVAAANSAALAAAMAVGRVIDVPHLPTLADGVAGGMDEDAITLPLARAVIDEVVSCSETEIAAALAALAFDEGQLVEGAAALALAGWMQMAEHMQGKTSVVVLCGGNVDRRRLVDLLRSER